MAGGIAGVIVVQSQQTKLALSGNAAVNCEGYVAAVVDLPVRILNNRLKIAHRGQIAADVRINIAACSDMRALVGYAQTRKFGS